MVQREFDHLLRGLLEFEEDFRFGGVVEDVLLLAIEDRGHQRQHVGVGVLGLVAHKTPLDDVFELARL